MNQKLLHDEAHRIRHPHVQVRRSWHTASLSQPHRPWVDQQELEIPHFLSRHPGPRHCGVWSASSLEAAAVKWREELRVEPAVLFPETVVSRRRHEVAEELLDEAGTAKRRLNVAGQLRVER